MLGLASAVVSLIAMAAIIYVAFKRKQSMSYVTGFVAGLLIYVVLLLLEVGFLQSVTSANHFRFSLYQQEIWALTAAYSFAFLLSYIAISPMLDIRRGRRGDAHIPNARPYFVLGFALVLAYIVMFGKSIVTAADYAEGAAMRHGNVAFSAASVLIVYYLIFLASLLVAKGKYSFAGWISVSVVLLGFWSSDKNPMFLGLVSLVYVVLASGYRIRPWKLGVALLAGAAFFLFIPVFSVYRAGGIGLLESVSLGLSRITLTRMDPAGPYGSIIDVLAGDGAGVTYLESAQVLIPRVVLPFERGLDPAEHYAQQTIENWQPGRGLGFSPLAEAYLNAGFFGPFVHAPLFLAIWLGCWLLVQRMFRLAKLGEVFPHFFYVMGFYLMVLSFRTSLVGSVKVVILQMVGLAAVLVLARAIGLFLRRARV